MPEDQPAEVPLPPPAMPIYPGNLPPPEEDQP